MSGKFTSDDAPIWAFHLREDYKSDLPDCFPQDGKFGYIDKAGKVVITPQFFVARDFAEGSTAVRVEQTADSKYGYIDRTGHMVIAPRFHQAGPFSEGLAAVETSARVVGNQVVDIAWGFIDKAGMRFPTGTTSPATFRKGRARVAIKLGVSMGYINRDGKMIIPPKFTEAFDFSDGLAAACSDECVYIDRSGSAVLTDLDAYWPFCDGLAVVGPRYLQVSSTKRGG